MAAIEVTGKTLDEAKKLAAEKLGVDVKGLAVTVLEEAKGKGLFGQSKVRIKAESSEAAREKAAEAEAQEDAKEAFLSEGPAPVEEAPTKPARAPRKSAEPKKAAVKPAKKAKTEVAEPAEEHAGESLNGKEAEAEPREEVVATEEDAARLVGLLREFLEAGSLSVSAESKQIAGRYVTLELDGKDVAFLVGKHGEVLNALQYLINIIAGRKFNNGVRATLDGNNYRRRREEALTKLATNIANEVKSRGEEAVLDALPAFERRIVHKALSEFEGISTYSEGEEPNRRVVIAPAD
jgi:spoIIIJ-associated protein